MKTEKQKQKQLEQIKIWQKKNPKKMANYNKKWKDANKEKYHIYQKNYQKKQSVMLSFLLEKYDEIRVFLEKNRK